MRTIHDAIFPDGHIPTTQTNKLLHIVEGPMTQKILGEPLHRLETVRVRGFTGWSVQQMTSMQKSQNEECWTLSPNPTNTHSAKHELKKAGKTLAHTKEQTPLLSLSGNLQENLEASPCPAFSRATTRMPHRTCVCVVNSPHNRTCGKRAVWIFFRIFFFNE